VGEIAEPPALSGKGGLPLVAKVFDFFVASADEVPPHDELFLKRLTAEEKPACGCVGGVAYLDLVASGGEVTKFVLIEGLPINRQGTHIQKDGMLMLVFDGECHRALRVKRKLCSYSRPRQRDA